LIAADVVAAVSAENPLQLRSQTGEISASAVTLEDALFEDLRPAEVLTRLAALDGWEWRVWGGQRLVYGPQDADVAWRVDAGEVAGLARSAALAESAAYATFRSRNNETLRTTQVTDSVLAQRVGAVRVRRVDAATTSETAAESGRTAALAAMAARRLRARVSASRAWRPTGGLGRIWEIRAGQVVELMDFPITVTQTVDAIRRWRVGETEVDLESGRVALAPLEPLPDLINMVV